MIEKIAAKIRVKATSNPLILHRAVDVENRYAPSGLVISQRIEGSEIVFETVIEGDRINTLRRTLDDFLASVKLASSILAVLEGGEEAIYGNGGKRS